MKQNAGNEEFVCGEGFEWNAGCGGTASSATPAVARQHRHFRRRPPHRAHVINTVDAVTVSKSFVYKDWSNAAAFAAHHGRIPPGEGH